MAAARAQAESTQELGASDVIEVIEMASAAPAGIDIEFPAPPDPEEWRLTRELCAQPARRNLQSVVVAAVGLCGVILIAAAGIRVASASDAPTVNAMRSAPEAKLKTTSVPGSSPAARAPNASPLAVTIPAALPAAPEKPTTGTLLLDGSARAGGGAWLDGRKLTASSALVACGPHRIKFGPWSRARTVDVPCGAEVHVSR